jgi:SAM-dependent methyltransferase
MIPVNEPTAVSIQREYYAETAAAYDRMHLMDAEHNLALEYIARDMRHWNMQSILDVGCGTGRGVKFLLDHALDVTGVEPVMALLETGCRDHGLPAERMLQGTGESLQFADKSFDASMELGVLHHVQNPGKVVAEMIRVSRRAIFISDCNRFGQGRFLGRLIKVAAWKLGLWSAIDYVRTRGKGYTISKEDGLAYSYSVYDSFDQLADWADHIHVIPTSPMTANSWLHPLAACSHVLLVALRNS